VVSVKAMKLPFRKHKIEALQAQTRKTDELEKAVDEVAVRVARLKAIGTVVSVRTRQGKARST
jgi:hypothetical protein